jgi:hypothetical protein
MKQALLDKKREKASDLAARQKIKAQIEQDKVDRARRAQEEKDARKGIEKAPVAPVAVASANFSSKGYTEARLQFRLADSAPVTATFPADATLSA